MTAPSIYSSDKSAYPALLRAETTSLFNKVNNKLPFAPHDFPNEKIQLAVETQIRKLSSEGRQQPLQLAAYIEEGKAGHGNLIIEKGAKIQGYVTDMPDDFDTQTKQPETRKCGQINQNSQSGEAATVCVGSDNQIPEEGDVDFVAINNKWHKIRSGTAVVSKDEKTNEHSIEPKGMDLWSPYGVHPNTSWDIEKSIKDNLSRSGSVVHEVNNNPVLWSNPPVSIEPAQYLNRLNEETHIGPLPVPPPPIPQMGSGE